MLVRVVRADHPKVPRSPPIVHGCMTLRPSRLRGLTSPPTYSPRPRLLYLDVFKSLYQAGLLALVQGPLLVMVVRCRISICSRGSARSTGRPFTPLVHPVGSEFTDRIRFRRAWLKPEGKSISSVSCIDCLILGLLPYTANVQGFGLHFPRDTGICIPGMTHAS